MLRPFAVPLRNVKYRRLNGGAEELLPRAEGANISRNNAAEWLQDRRDMMKWWANYLDRKAKLAIAA